MISGTVANYDGKKGYGYISPEGGGKNIYVNIKEVDRAYVSRLAVGQRLTFEIKIDHFGRSSAVRLKLFPKNDKHLKRGL